MNLPLKGSSASVIHLKTQGGPGGALASRATSQPQARSYSPWGFAGTCFNLALTRGTEGPWL